MSSESEPIGYPEPDGEHTGGHSGSVTSKERAVREASEGTKQSRERVTMFILSRVRGNGVTVKELREMTGMHHGQASSVLSTLHKAGRIDRLTERRDRCQVYVQHGYAGDRESVPHGRKKNRAALFEAFEAGFRLGSDEDESIWPDPMLMALFEKWEENRGE